MSRPNLDGHPWYKEPWPWLLMAGPAIVVVAGIVTAWIAISTSDGLVTEDYYTKGLAANQTIARSDTAARLGITAGLRFSSDTVNITLNAESAEFSAPEKMLITVSHPTRAGLDRNLVAARSGTMYGGALRLPAAGHWIVLLEDESKTWRLLGNVVLPAAGEVRISGKTAPADIRNQKSY